MQSKISYTSHLLSLFFKSMCWIIPSSTLGIILFNINFYISDFIGSLHIQNLDFTFPHRIVIALIATPPLAITVCICVRLARLFGLYEKGILFEEENIKLIKSISIYMIASQIVHLICQPFMSAALTFNNPVGERMVQISFGSTNLSTLTTAFIILLASWIIKEAQQLKAEAALTI